MRGGRVPSKSASAPRHDRQPLGQCRTPTRVPSGWAAGFEVAARADWRRFGFKKTRAVPRARNCFFFCRGGEEPSPPPHTRTHLSLSRRTCQAGAWRAATGSVRVKKGVRRSARAGRLLFSSPSVFFASVTPDVGRAEHCFHQFSRERLPRVRGRRGASHRTLARALTRPRAPPHRRRWARRPRCARALHKRATHAGARIKLCGVEQKLLPSHRAGFPSLPGA
jgi:hypothetical protein